MAAWFRTQQTWLSPCFSFFLPLHIHLPWNIQWSPHPLAFRYGINVKKLAFLCWDNEMFVSKSAIKKKKKKTKRVLAWNPENSRPQK